MQHWVAGSYWSRCVSYAQPPYARCVTVPEGHLFILGDNTTASLDSRSLGPLPAREVLGRVRWVLRAGP